MTFAETLRRFESWILGVFLVVLACSGAYFALRVSNDRVDAIADRLHAEMDRRFDKNDRSLNLIKTEVKAIKSEVNSAP